MTPGGKLELNMKGLHWIVDIVECCHRVPSVGYCISEVRSKLKEEYKKLTGKEIGALRKQGVDVVFKTNFKQFVFMGDTTTKVFELHPEVFEFPVIFIECTLFGDGLEEKAEKTTHVHWNLLKPYVKQHPECLFMLIHFSLRWNESQIEEYFTQESIKENITNLGLWLDKGIRIFKKEQQTTSTN